MSPIQDVVTRYAHQSGFHVERRFGWDCHGLPVEYEIDKTLGIKVSKFVIITGKLINSYRTTILVTRTGWTLL